MTTTTQTTSLATLREHITLLQREQAMAALAGLDGNDLFMADLREELEATRSAYVGAAVTEIASLRAALGGPLLG